MSKTLNTVGYHPDWEKIDALVEEGYIRCVHHPDNAALSLYNYTPKTQFEQHWTKDTLICRGLIAREVGGHREVIARPFPKFFNWQEVAEDISLEDGPWQVYEKMDGSLGILYEFAPGDYRIATRGSFTSEQALKATAWIKAVDLQVHRPGITQLYEIIYPDNRIVVNYRDQRLVLLGQLVTQTGEVDTKLSCTSQRRRSYGPRFEKVKFHGIQDTIPTDQRENKEGYVLVNDKGFRVKVKHDEYVRLHKILTNTSSRTVWEYLSDPEKDFNELLDNVPDEFYEWVKDIKRGLESEYFEIVTVAEAYYAYRPITSDRRVLAENFKKFKTPAILFAMLDGKDYSGLIWKLIKPERVLPFANQEEIEDA